MHSNWELQEGVCHCDVATFGLCLTGYVFQSLQVVIGQLANAPTHGLATHALVSSRTRQVVD